MTKGFTQQGVEYSETFSHVVKPPTGLLILSMAAVKHRKIHQVDVNNAFLHDKIQETVFISQPPVCKLKKEPYGLKKVLRAWFDRFSHFVLSQGFNSSVADPSLFVLKKDDDLVVLLYVDDMLVTRNSSAVFDDLLQLKREFSMKDLSQVHHFLGILVETIESGLFLSPGRYAQLILQKANLLDCKLVSTPLLSKLQMSDSSSLLLILHYSDIQLDRWNT